MMELPDHVIKMMSEVEQKMDTGEVKHVVLPSGQRLPLTNSMQEKFGLVNGQMINGIIFKAMKDEAERILIQGVMDGLIEDLPKPKAVASGGEGGFIKGVQGSTDPANKPYGGSLEAGFKTPSGCVDTERKPKHYKTYSELNFDVQAGDEINLEVKSSDGFKFSFGNPDLGNSDPGQATIKFTVSQVDRSFEQAQQPATAEERSELGLGELAPSRTIS